MMSAAFGMVACGGSVHGATEPTGGAQSGTSQGALAGVAATESSGTGGCELHARAPRHPEHHSDKLVLDVPESISLVTPVVVHVDIKERVLGRIPLELTVFGPSGKKHHQVVMHHNAVNACPGCDPVVGGPPDQCQNVCEVRSTGWTRVDLPLGVVDETGEYTFLLVRPGTDQAKPRGLCAGAGPERQRASVCGD